MKKDKFSFSYQKYEMPDSLPEAHRELADAARAACATAYAPYSGFRVGAAVLFDDGEILSASNQESEVFPSGMCAERAVLYYAQANAAGRHIRAIAIASLPGERECTPCGACRQVIADTENRQGSPLKVIMCSDHSATVVDSARSLLPFIFEL